ncbi:ROK family protein, partial [bacterium]|nr:ROK family protein [bacterium]
EKRSFMEIIGQYREGHEPGREFVQAFFVNFGRAMANVINILDPDMVVLGGGLSNVEELYTHGVREVEKRVFSDGFETAIIKNQLGDSAGVIGAALIGC